MRLDQAQTLVAGDTVVDPLITHLTVKSVESVHNDNEELLHILVVTEDNMASKILTIC